MSSSPDPKVSAAIKQMTADLQTEGTDVVGVPREIAEAAADAGLQISVGTIAMAGQLSTGDYSVWINKENGQGYTSTWPRWAFELAKDALLGNKRVWVSSNGDPLGSNLVSVLILA